MSGHLPLDSAMRISRKTLDLFIQCPVCAYLQETMDVREPRSFPLTLNLAIDDLLKQEFDAHRANGTAHPAMARAGQDLRPFQDQRLIEWRDGAGVSRTCADSGVTLYGKVDDLWQDATGAVHVIDYKTTGKESNATLDRTWSDGYRRQAEIYQWILQGQGLDVSNRAWILWYWVDRSQGFNGALKFGCKLTSFDGQTGWIPKALADLRRTLECDALPPRQADCERCIHRRATFAALRDLGVVSLQAPPSDDPSPLPAPHGPG